MKKKLISICMLVMAIVSCMSILTSCFSSNSSSTENTTYTIQYTDDAGVHTINVENGMPFSLDVIPTKVGYEFTGLYDAEVGGTQYVSANGSSLSPFMDKKNMVLFPQFKAKEYTIILDYQGAPATGNRQVNVSYGSNLPELPKNLILEHKEFSGWYTEAECGGIQIADKYGLIPLVSVMNEDNFDISGKSITLYAGFEIEKYTVTFCYEAGIDTEEMKIAYDTPISEVVTKTRVNDNAVLTWSKTQGGEVWNGKVTSDMVLYAKEYAPVIELDTNGGNEISSVVARAGSTISLPIPTKDLAKFAYWEDMSGNKYTSTTMPDSSISLKAVWQAKIVFDENGGTDVDDLSVEAGNTITLPIPEKEGFIFAGWYTEDKEKYSATKMPSSGIKLKAGWYKEKEDLVTFISPTEQTWGRSLSANMSKLCFTFDYSKYFDNKTEVYIKIDCHTKIKTDDDVAQTCYAEFYSQKQANPIYLLDKITLPNVTDSYNDFNFSTSFSISNDFFICWYQTRDYYNWHYFDMYLSDFYFVVHYPDTTNFYL